MVDERVPEPENFLKVWREQRAYRVGYRLGVAGTVLSLIALFVDIQFSPPPVIYGDVALLTGCFLSLVLSRPEPKPNFSWMPIMIGFWLSILPSLYLTGGILSPFMGYDLAALLVCTVVVQNTVKPKVLAAFVFLHIGLFLVLSLFTKSSVSRPPPVFVAMVGAITLAAIAVSIYEVLRTEQDLSAEFASRYRELSYTRAELHREEAANLAKTAFLANVSHELRTPLAAIVGYSELLQGQDLKANESARMIETIRRNGDQLARLVDDLLDLSKVEAGKIEVAPQLVKLSSVLGECLTLINVIAGKKNLRVEVVYSGAVPELLYTDPMRLKQILLNLLGNAVKFTDQGLVRIVVDSSREHGLDVVNISVHDTGTGIRDSERERLFKPFSQGDHAVSGRFGGTGLGLSLSKNLAHLLGGDLVLVRSQPGAGSIFCLHLPVGEVRQQIWREGFYADSEKDGLRAFRAGDLLEGKRILVIDDSEDNRLMIQMMLQSAGAQVLTAADAVVGIGRALEGSIDAVLLDLQMPMMDGFETALTLRARGFAKPILALTASARAEDRERSIAAGCNTRLTKPISRSALVEAVAEATGALSSNLGLPLEPEA